MKQFNTPLEVIEYILATYNKASREDNLTEEQVDDIIKEVLDAIKDTFTTTQLMQVDLMLTALAHLISIDKLPSNELEVLSMIDHYTHDVPE